MRVILPRPATGKEIVEALKKSTIKNGLEFSGSETLRYEPGSLRTVVEKLTALISEIASEEHGWWIFKRNEKWGKRQFSFSPTNDEEAFAPEKTYEALEVTACYGPFSDFVCRIEETSHWRFRDVREKLELILESFYAELSTETSS